MLDAHDGVLELDLPLADDRSCPRVPPRHRRRERTPVGEITQTG
ncbi:MAG TPA: hypothetical protein VLP43_00775 [Solirubrobacteraceae bacterium]|nr:hypothetical protein [Solirubrobacteraceae bacterium]